MGDSSTVSNKFLDHISVCQPRETFGGGRDRLHLKANRRLASHGRVTNGELVTVKSVHAEGGIELTDGRVLDKDFREFLPGYAVTSYGSQGRTVDYVLFSDSTVKAATNAQQWYVTIHAAGVAFVSSRRTRNNSGRMSGSPAIAVGDRAGRDF